MDLCRVRRDPETRRTDIEAVRQLGEHEATGIRVSVAFLNAYARSREIFPLLVGNAEDVKRASSLMPSILSVAKPQQHAEAQRLRNELNRCLINFLTVMRLYLDHTETRLKRTYGSSSDPINSFVKARSAEYDHTAEYRLLYKLRNYVQHCGMPVHIAGIASSAGASRSEDIHEVHMGADVAELLDTYDSWGPAKPDLQEIGSLFRPDTAVPAVMEALRRIEKEVIRSELPQLLGHGRSVAKLLREAETDNAVAALIDIQPVEDGTNLHFIEPPYGVLRMLRLVHIERDGRPRFRTGDT